MERRAELAWKWLLRLGGLGCLIWVIVGPLKGNVPIPVYVLLGGMIGLPSAWGLQEKAQQQMGKRGR